MTTITRRFKVTPAFVIALIALFVAMGGSAVAVTAIASNSIRSKHIANGQVKNKDLAADAVRSGKVLDASLTGADVADQSLTGDDVTDGTVGGADVTDGSLTGADVADDSLSGADVNESSLQGLMASQVRIVAVQTAPLQFGAERVASCAANEKAIGGGAASAPGRHEQPDAARGPDHGLDARPRPAGRERSDRLAWRRPQPRRGRSRAPRVRDLRAEAALGRDGTKDGPGPPLRGRPRHVPGAQGEPTWATHVVAIREPSLPRASPMPTFRKEDDEAQRGAPARPSSDAPSGAAGGSSRCARRASRRPGRSRPPRRSDGPCPK